MEETLERACSFAAGTQSCSNSTCRCLSELLQPCVHDIGNQSSLLWSTVQSVERKEELPIYIEQAVDKGSKRPRLRHKHSQDFAPRLEFLLHALLSPQTGLPCVKITRPRLTINQYHPLLQNERLHGYWRAVGVANVGDGWFVGTENLTTYKR